MRSQYKISQRTCSQRIFKHKYTYSALSHPCEILDTAVLGLWLY